MKVFCVLVLACAVVLQVADAKKGGKCGKYKDEMMKIAKDMYEKGEMPECTQQYSEDMDAMFNAKSHEEMKEKKKEFHKKVKEMSDDEKEELFGCMKSVGELIVSNMEEKPPQECTDKWMKPPKKGKKDSKEEED